MHMTKGIMMGQDEVTNVTMGAAGITLGGTGTAMDIDVSLPGTIPLRVVATSH